MSEYTTRDTQEFELVEVSVYIAKSTRFDQSVCNQYSASWSKILNSVTRTLRIVDRNNLKYICPFWFQDVELASLIVTSNQGFKFREVNDSAETSFTANILLIQFTSFC